ncbi:MAG: RNA polymerase sigma-70 factor [Rikenellaceae bacterium]
MDRKTIFEKCYKDNFKDLYRFLMLYCNDPKQREDVIQDVFTTLWEKGNFEKIENIRAYLFNAVKNRLFNSIRDNNRRNELLEQWQHTLLHENNSKECFNMDSLCEIVNSAVESLPPRCKEIYILNRKNKLKYAQIAQLLGISVNTVENQMSSALQKIRDAIKRQADKI